MLAIQNNGISTYEKLLVINNIGLKGDNSFSVSILFNKYYFP